CTTSLQRVSVDAIGMEADGPSTAPSFSANGRYLVFASYADNLVPSDTNFARDVFLIDRCIADGVAVVPCTPSIERVSLAADGSEADGNSDIVQLGRNVTDDDRFVVFDSAADNLVASDFNFVNDGFIRDRCIANGVPVVPCTPTTIRVTVGTGGVEGNGTSLG